MVTVKEDEVIKKRIKKGYRHPELDRELRQQRTKLEARLLSSARRLGVPVPRVISVSECEIRMEFVPGKSVKEILSENFHEDVCFEIGSGLGKLHRGGIIHGDPTTSNMIYNGRVFFIDFGLGFFSTRKEDMAVDLSVLFESVKSAHFKYLNEIWENIMEGYSKENPESEAVCCVLRKIEKRKRYA
ncbi:MAG: Kae1-associated serine/threonine protein kinase [Candidatus Micrarchaeota archaeon]|nr:Kae1-associated serine/threonine protein kinase [Candidatus Micrarchaeota archaeon]